MTEIYNQLTNSMIEVPDEIVDDWEESGVPILYEVPPQFPSMPLPTITPDPTTAVPTTDPYAAFKAAFEAAYGRPITQHELNNPEGELNDILDGRPGLTRLLPIDRQYTLDAKVLSDLSNEDLNPILGYILNRDPKGLLNFSADRLTQFDIPTITGFYQVMSQVDPEGQLTKDLAATIQRVSGQAPTPGPPPPPGTTPPPTAAPTAPPTGTAPPGTAVPPSDPLTFIGSGSEIPRFQEPTIGAGGTGYDIFRNTLNPTQATTQSPTFRLSDLGSIGGEPIQGPEIPTGPEGEPPPDARSDQPWILNPNWNPDPQHAGNPQNPKYIQNPYYRKEPTGYAPRPPLEGERAAADLEATNLR
ncbi:MAG: hypothetical protein Q8R28_01090, partial [Dehalococcoidia bacterium]|nr:hypothetical protein [Dehalococcoidia bacterium]